jgi:hypothetical protein
MAERRRRPENRRRAPSAVGAEGAGRREGEIASRYEDEQARVGRALQGDARAFRDVYDACFRLAWAWSIRMTGDARMAERLTARALHGTFAALADDDGATSLGRRVLERLEDAFRELQAEARAGAKERTQESGA